LPTDASSATDFVSIFVVLTVFETIDFATDLALKASMDEMRLVNLITVARSFDGRLAAAFDSVAGKLPERVNRPKYSPL
jgi:hypothetical protein